MRRLIFKLAVLIVALLAVAWYVRAVRGRDAAPDPQSGGRVTETARPRVLLIGVDGLDWERAERLVSEGRMPALAGIMERGASGLLESIPPYVSPTVWTSIATGKLGEKHGIGGFTAYGQRGGTVELIGTGMIKCKRLWDILADAERSSGVIGWLVTYPPVPVTDYTISSRAVNAISSEPIPGREGSLDEMRVGVHPAELWDSVSTLGIVPSEVGEDEVRGHLGSVEHLDNEEVERRLGDIADRLAADRTTVELVRHLMSSHPTDLTAVYFRGNDIISHFFWRYWEPDSWTRGTLDPEAVETLAPVIDRYYESVDEMIAEVVRFADDRTVVIICSDHGFAGHRGHAGFEPQSEGEMAFGIAMHRDKGVIAMAGPGVAGGARIEGASVLDVAPTVLAALGLPAGRDMDGRPLASAFDREFLDRTPIAYIDTYETGDRVTSDGPAESPVDDEIKELLKSLGYIN